MAKEKEVGLICEQGDLGLHYTPLNETDQAIYNRQSKEDEENKEKK